MSGVPTLSRIIAALVCAVAIGVEEAPLPQRAPGEPLDFEPSLQLHDGLLPGPDEVAPVKDAAPDVKRAEKNLERAKRKEQRWRQLQRSGVVSKVEMESASRQASAASLKLAEARVTYWHQQVAALRTQAETDASAKELLATAEASLKTAQILAADTGVLHRARCVELAERNVERQQRLLALGIGSRGATQRAVETLAKLKAAAP